MHLYDLIQQKLELFRLEQRYTKKRNRRSTFVSDALYVDGEYIYSPASPHFSRHHTGSDSEIEKVGKQSTSSSNHSQTTGASGISGVSGVSSAAAEKKSRRISRMGLEKMDWRRGGSSKDGVERGNARVSVREVRWDGGGR
ncbi:hypothetical protein HYFRA_00008643 [Hymenoscyphus fraxineus]|uniref:Uncharacterized protein n=1 Tax=Hymenoscyphus fraxineus TaxID=746836 RepID=A0A9N9KWW4_9HELO|nr:hypothetical protein HYFRA_00008643 [Hymenoscyphus fraxineus]